MVAGTSKGADLARARKLDRLAELAQIRSDAELKRFAAFRGHIDIMRAEREKLRARLAATYGRDEPLSLAELRLASLEAGRLALEIARIDAELTRLGPKFDAVHRQAMREFGRVQALHQLAGQERDKLRK